MHSVCTYLVNKLLFQYEFPTALTFYVLQSMYLGVRKQLKIKKDFGNLIVKTLYKRNETEAEFSRLQTCSFCHLGRKVLK